ncbi:class II aldolase/adducin family protein [Psychrobacter sp.]|uniref:class II aldolase/adducin family protein n=1 Tax=Psychrobacter sp. TaxID=56811 RepID=UPI003F98654C
MQTDTTQTGDTQTDSKPNPAQNMSEQEWQMRVDLAACYRMVASYGWDDLVFTHISARVPDTEDEFLTFYRRNPLPLR